MIICLPVCHPDADADNDYLPNNLSVLLSLEHGVQAVPGLQDLLSPDDPGGEVLCQDLRRGDRQLQGDIPDV